MALTFYAHPFSAFCQKVLVALHETGAPFVFRQIDLFSEADAAALRALWPFRKFPMLVDDSLVLPESSVIIEHLDRHYPGASRLIPDDPDLAREVRLLDRVMDNYLLLPMQKVAFDALREERQRDPAGVAEARATMRTAYTWLEQRLAGRHWAAGAAFSLADCGAAPGLFFADWTEPMPEACPLLRDYRARLLARPSVKRVVDAARPYRHLFPLRDPGRD